MRLVRKRNDRGKDLTLNWVIVHYLSITVKAMRSWIGVILVVSLLFGAGVGPAYGGELVIEYGYSPVDICISATARLQDGTILGEARLLELRKGKYYKVEERHLSRDGSLVYKAISLFSIGFGVKISEKKVLGEKKIELFSSWPSG